MTGVNVEEFPEGKETLKEVAVSGQGGKFIGRKILHTVEYYGIAKTKVGAFEM